MVGHNDRYYTLRWLHFTASSSFSFSINGIEPNMVGPYSSVDEIVEKNRSGLTCPFNSPSTKYVILI
jgi:hypothetical protein